MRLLNFYTKTKLTSAIHNLQYLSACIASSVKQSDPAHFLKVSR